MPNKRKNKCTQGSSASGINALWFTNNVARSKKRNKQAKKSRKRNR